jgi:hypothetical protein
MGKLAFRGNGKSAFDECKQGDHIGLILSSWDYYLLWTVFYVITKVAHKFCASFDQSGLGCIVG